jgi:hypothetical protein
MNGQENNWEDLVKRRLEQFSPEPPPEIWERIQSEMAGRKRRNALLVVFRRSAAAAVLLIAIVTGILVLNDHPAPENSSVSINDNPEIREIPAIAPSDMQNSKMGKRLTAGLSRQNTAAIQEPVQVSTVANSEISSDRTTLTFVTMTAGRQSFNKPDELLQKYIPEKILADIKETEDLKVRKTEDNSLLASDTKKESRTVNKTNVWNVGIHVSPDYSSFSSDYSAEYAKSMSSSGRQSQSGVGGGISVGYKASDRWKFESGLYFARSGDKSGNSNRLFASKADYAYVFADENKYFSTAVSVLNGKINMNSTAGVIQLTQTPDKSTLVSGAESALGLNSALLTSGEFYQVFDFLEVPLTARYRISNGKLGLELLGGISTNIVVGNQVFMENGSARDYVGKTNDISKFGFSGLTGLALIYPVSKKIFLSVEPHASYWINSLNTSKEVDFRPWRIGVYSGVTYSF